MILLIFWGPRVIMWFALMWKKTSSYYHQRRNRQAWNHLPKPLPETQYETVLITLREILGGTWMELEKEQAKRWWGCGGWVWDTWGGYAGVEMLGFRATRVQQGTQQGL